MVRVFGPIFGEVFEEVGRRLLLDRRAARFAASFAAFSGVRSPSALPHENGSNGSSVSLG